MKVLTIKEPWATLIIEGYKKYEFRSWKTNYRGKILIHAGKSIDKKGKERFKDYNLNYSCGEIIGEAYITDCIKVNEELVNSLRKIDSNVYKKSIFKEENGKLGLWNYYEQFAHKYRILQKSLFFYL